jgi:hypothetical protein
MYLRDIFICHAGEDKDDIVRPMVEALNQAGISCWYDEAEIRWGDSVIQKVNEGLAKSRYVVVVFSPAFVQKNWPQRELNAILSQEASTGEVKVLPLLAGSEVEKKQILSHFPLLNDKRYLRWDGNLGNIVKAMQSRLHPGDRSTSGMSKSPPPAPTSQIPLPKIKKQFSQRDKDMFLRNAFTVIKGYFQNALNELSRQYQGVETDFAEVHNFKFLATIYLHGEIANKCKIWIGGLQSSDSIAYQSGRFTTIEGNDSFNDELSVVDDKQSLGFRPLMWFGGNQNNRVQLLTTESAAEYLWRQFSENLV